MNASKQIEKLLNFWFKPMDPIPIRVFETILVATMCYYFSSYLKTPDFWLTEKGFHVSEGATLSSYIPPPPLPPEAWLTPIIICFYIVCFVYILGHWRRVL